MSLSEETLIKLTKRQNEGGGYDTKKTFIDGGIGMKLASEMYTFHDVSLATVVRSSLRTTFRDIKKNT